MKSTKTKPIEEPDEGSAQIQTYVHDLAMHVAQLDP